VLLHFELKFAMSSSKTLSRQRLVHEILRHGSEMAPCNSCKNARVKSREEKPRCIVGPQSLKCSECVRKGLSHCDVTLSNPQWMKLCDSRDALRRDIEKIEEEEVEILHKQSKLLQELTTRRMKKIHLRKQLRFSESRASSAVAKEIEDLEEEDALEQALLPSEEDFGVDVQENPFAFHSILEMSPSAWDDILDPDLTTGATGETPARNSTNDHRCGCTQKITLTPPAPTVVV
jgi:DNA gyrase/topoisomerase IV subunit A